MDTLYDIAGAVLAAECRLDEINTLSEFLLSDESHDVCDAEAVRTADHSEAEAVHDLTHRPFVAADIFFERSFQCFLGELSLKIENEVGNLQGESIVFLFPEFGSILFYER